MILSLAAEKPVTMMALVLETAEDPAARAMMMMVVGYLVPMAAVKQLPPN